MEHAERRIASGMSLGNWSPVRSRCRRSKISQAWMVCEGSSFLAAFDGDKICLLSSRLLPAAGWSYRAATLRHCFSSSDNFQSFSFCAQDQEILQFLIHLVRPILFMLQVCHSDRLLMVLCGLHRLLQRCVHYANEVPCKI